jgi:hypothetical protein
MRAFPRSWHRRHQGASRPSRDADPGRGARAAKEHRLGARRSVRWTRPAKSAYHRPPDMPLSVTLTCRSAVLGVCWGRTVKMHERRRHVVDLRRCRRRYRRYLRVDVRSHVAHALQKLCALEAQRCRRVLGSALVVTWLTFRSCQAGTERTHMPLSAAGRPPMPQWVNGIGVSVRRHAEDPACHERSNRRARTRIKVRLRS